MTHLQKGKKHLSSVDPVMAELVQRIHLKKREYHGGHFRALVRSIISQQLSTKVAEVIFTRFQKLYDDEFPLPAQVLDTPIEKLRSIGLSSSKVVYIRDLAEHVAQKKLDLGTIDTKDELEIVAHLTQVKGIGTWTAEMFMMFALERPDVFSHGDLGLRNAIKKLYKLRGDPSQKRVEKIIKVWSPYKTLACLYLWASLDQKE